jgi:hypothetical protein
MFSGVFAKIHDSGNFQEFTNKFSIEKVVEWVHASMDQGP